VARTIYLDTALWYDLAEGRIRTESFESAIHDGIITPVFSFIHLMEFAQSEITSRNRVTRYIDALIQTGRACWIKSLPVVSEEELGHGYLRFQAIDSGPVKVLKDAFVDTLRITVQGLDRVEARTYNVTTLVSIMSGLRQFRKTRALLDIVRLQLLRLKAGKSVDPSRSEYVRNVWADMPRSVQTPRGLWLDITPALTDQFLRQLRWEEIPAIALRVALLNGWSLGLGGAKASDFEDLFHIAPPLAYCDVAFTDKRVYAALERGGATRLPKRNSEFSAWCREL
jgi:hypothetical protein